RHHDRTEEELAGILTQADGQGSAGREKESRAHPGQGETRNGKETKGWVRTSPQITPITQIDFAAITSEIAIPSESLFGSRSSSAKSAKSANGLHTGLTAF